MMWLSKNGLSHRFSCILLPAFSQETRRRSFSLTTFKSSDVLPVKRRLSQRRRGNQVWAATARGHNTSPVLDRKGIWEQFHPGGPQPERLDTKIDVPNNSDTPGCYPQSDTGLSVSMARNYPADFDHLPPNVTTRHES